MRLKGIEVDGLSIDYSVTQDGNNLNKGGNA